MAMLQHGARGLACVPVPHLRRPLQRRSNQPRSIGAEASVHAIGTSGTERRGKFPARSHVPNIHFGPASLAIGFVLGFSHYGTGVDYTAAVGTEHEERDRRRDV